MHTATLLKIYLHLRAGLRLLKLQDSSRTRPGVLNGLRPRTLARYILTTISLATLALQVIVHAYNNLSLNTRLDVHLDQK